MATEVTFRVTEDGIVLEQDVGGGKQQESDISGITLTGFEAGQTGTATLTETGVLFTSSEVDPEGQRAESLQQSQDLMSRFTGFQEAAAAAAESIAAAAAGPEPEPETHTYTPTETGQQITPHTGEVTVEEVPEVTTEEVPEVTTTTVTTDTTEISAQLTELYSTITGLSSQLTSLNEQFLEQRQEFLSTLGEFETDFTNQLTGLEQELGVQIDTSNEELQAAIQKAYQDGASEDEIKAILQGFVETEVADTEALTELGFSSDDVDLMMAGEKQPHLNAIRAVYGDEGVAKYQEALSKWRNQGGSVNDQVVDDVLETTEEDTYTYTASGTSTLLEELVGYASMDFSSLNSMLEGLIGEDQDLSTTSSGEMMQLILAQTAIDQSNDYFTALQNVYSSIAARTEETLQGVLSTNQTAIEEMDLITDIDWTEEGAKVTATTMESLLVKVAKQQADLGVSSYEAQQVALEAEYNYTKGQMEQQNARLEGYMKAKLNWMGAADSSAGLSLMATVIDNAQAQLTLYDTNYWAADLQLENAKTQLMYTYLNTVEEQGISLAAKESAAYEAYNTKMDEIALSEIMSLQEVQTTQLTALTTLTNNLYQIEQDQKQWEFDVSNEMWNRAYQETSLALDIAQTEKNDAANNLSTLINTYAGKDWDSLPDSVKDSMMDYTSALGLPEEFLAQSLVVEYEPMTYTYNAQLSEQLGYLVATDKYGNIQPIEGMTSSATGDMVEIAYSGDYAGNCVFYVREQYSNMPYGLDSIANRESWVDLYGFTIEEDMPQVGDVVQTSEGTWGHTAIIVGFTSGGEMILEEANYRSNTVTTGRTLALDDSSVIGFWHPVEASYIMPTFDYQVEGLSPSGVETYSTTIPYKSDDSSSDNLGMATTLLDSAYQDKGSFTQSDVDAAREYLDTSEELEAFNELVSSVSEYQLLESEAIASDVGPKLESGEYTPEEVIVRLEQDYGLSATEAEDFLEGLGYKYDEDKQKWKLK